MPLKTYRPITPTHRYQTTLTYEELSGAAPHRPLLFAKKRASGRNNHGHLTVRHHGGGHKRFIRMVDFRRDKRGMPGTIESVEYDPGRTCFISLVVYPDGGRRYILATANMKKGMKVLSAPECDIAEGNCMPLKNIPLGTMIHNVEMIPGKGGQMARGAGAYAEILAKENQMVQIKLPSGEVRNIPEKCYATIGQVSNAEYMNIVIGSAGRKRWMGWRPRVRAVCMNPVDHPMGGGEGRSKSGGGWQHPVSPWGQPAKGFKTRNHKKASNQYIVRRRKGQP